MTPAELDRIALLIPEARWRVERVIQRMKERHGFDVFVGATGRTAAEVEASRLAGRSSASQTHSWHELGRAADLRPRKVTGGPNYDTGPASEPFWRALQAEATTFGLRCLAYRPDGSKLLLDTVNGKRWDPGHVEFRAPYATLAAAYAAEAKHVA
jgi:hypothetical protein